MNKPLVIITGASSGIGAAIATLFSEAGYSLGLLARNVDAMKKLDLPNTLSISVDITDFDAVKKAIHDCEAKFGPTDCLINNAGFAKGGDFTELNHADHVNTVSVNLQ